MTGFPRQSKFFGIEPSLPKLRPIFSKKNAWLSFGFRFLSGIEPFQPVIATPRRRNLSSLLSPPFAFPVASSIRRTDQAITFSDFRKQNLGDFAALGDLPCQERVQNVDGSLTPFKPFRQ
jgi:hypothetical protein